jgi:hypothetical protein
MIAVFFSLYDEDDNKTVFTSNKTSKPMPSEQQHKNAITHQSSIAATARSIFGTQMQQCLNAITIDISHAIADTGATNVFIMEGAPVNKKQKNKQATNNKLARWNKSKVNT